MKSEQMDSLRGCAHWNYRVVQTSKSHPDGEDLFMVCEVFYNADGTILGWHDATIGGNTLDDLRASAEMLVRAVDFTALVSMHRPVLIDPVAGAPGYGEVARNDR